MNGYVTEYTKDGRLYGSTVVAGSWEQAQERCDARGLGETVMGKLAD